MASEEDGTTTETPIRIARTGNEGAPGLHRTWGSVFGNAERELWRRCSCLDAAAG